MQEGSRPTGISGQNGKPAAGSIIRIRNIGEAKPEQEILRYGPAALLRREREKRKVSNNFALSVDWRGVHIPHDNGKGPAIVGLQLQSG